MSTEDFYRAKEKFEDVFESLKEFASELDKIEDSTRKELLMARFEVVLVRLEHAAIFAVKFFGKP